MAYKNYSFSSLTGGGVDSLDSFSGSLLFDGDIAITFDHTNDLVYVHLLDDDSGAAENSPNIIKPDNNAGTKRWVLKNSFSDYTDYYAKSDTVGAVGASMIGGGGTAVTYTSSVITISGATAGGVVTDHAALDNLDYDHAQHNGFVSTVFLTTVSGDLQTNIDGKSATSHLHDGRYYTETEVDTISGTINTTIDNTTTTITADIATVSGDLSSEIDSDITTHEAGSSHDGRYYTETEINTWRNSTTQTEMGYVHGVTSDIQIQFGGKSNTNHTHDARYYTETEVDTWRSSTTQTEMGYVHGTTSDIQTQFSGKSDTGHSHTETDISDLEHDAIKFQSITITSGTPDNGQVYVYNSTNGEWEFGNPSSSGTNATQIQGYDISDVDVPADGELMVWNAGNSEFEFTSASGIGLNSMVEDTTPQLGGDLDLNEHYIELTPIPNSDDTGSGQMAPMTVDANTIGVGSALHMDTDGHWIEADADVIATMPCSALALETGTGSKKVLLQGFMRNDGWTWTVGGIIYVSCTVGTLTQTAPAGNGDFVQIVGFATHADRMWFSPNLNLVEVKV